MVKTINFIKTGFLFISNLFIIIIKLVLSSLDIKGVKNILVELEIIFSLIFSFPFKIVMLNVVIVSNKKEKVT